MARVVMKFGGSLVASQDGIRRVADIVMASKERGDQVVVVVSALGDVTDLLLKSAYRAQTQDKRAIEPPIRQLRRIHLSALKGTGLNEPRRRAEVKEIDAKLEMLRQTLLGVSILGELSPRSKDMIVSFGERLTAPIVAAELETRGVRAPSLTGGEAGIVTDGSFGEAIPLPGRTSSSVKRSLLPLLLDGQVPVVSGFIARTGTGDITTLGRGGSDFTATLLASALQADEVWIWTDVDGIKTADPKVVKSAVTLAELSYAEAEELAFFGAKNMHPLALGPARSNHIPVRIKNGFSPQSPGTLITDRQTKSKGVVKAVAVVRNVGLLSVAGETLQGRPGTAAKVLSALAASGVNVLMISQSVSESSIGMVVRERSLRLAASALRRQLKRDRIAARVEMDPGIAVVAAVGAGMRGEKGVAAKVFEAVAEAGVNVRMIAQGSSELNISFVVDEGEAEVAARALHERVVRPSTR
jgi:aspartate kinase